MWVSGILYVKPTKHTVNKESIGLYWDDGLGVFHNSPKPEINRKKKQIVKYSNNVDYLSPFSATLNQSTF